MFNCCHVRSRRLAINAGRAILVVLMLMQAATALSQTPAASGAEPKVRQLLRFDPAARLWRSLPLPRSLPVASAPAPGNSEVVRSASGKVLYVAPREIGLYLLRWTENNTLHERQLYVGPVTCNDIMLGREPAGQIAACVPSSTQGMAMFIPVPPAFRR